LRLPRRRAGHPPHPTPPPASSIERLLAAPLRFRPPFIFSSKPLVATMKLEMPPPFQWCGPTCPVL
jgi:hypothetical protein